MSSTQVAVPTGGGIEALKELALTVPLAEQTEDASDQIVANILLAGNLADVLTPATAPGLGDEDEAVFIIYGIRRVEGGQDKDTGFYYLVDAEKQGSGIRQAYSTGARNLLAQLTWMYAQDAFPVTVKVWHRESKSNPGRVVQWLVEAEAF